MKEHIKLNELLESLLSELEVSALRLSKAINVDRSLVTKWINGTRIPSLHSDYLQKIAVALKNNIKNSYQLLEVQTICLRVIGTDSIVDDEDLILLALTEARGYSKKKSEENRKVQTKKGVSASLSSNDLILFGYDRIFLECLSLFEDAKNSSGSKKIYIKYDYNFKFFRSDSAKICLNKYNKWSDGIKTLLRLGWEVNFLINISDNANRTTELLRVVFDLIKYGKVQVHYLQKLGVWSQHSGMVIIPGTGALYTMPYVSGSMNSAFCMRTLNAVDAIHNQLMKLICDYSKPLIRYYTDNDVFLYRKRGLHFEQSAGMRVLHCNTISSPLIPLDLYKDLVTRAFHKPEDIQIIMQDYDNRNIAFLKNVLCSEYMDFYWNSTFTQLVYNNTMDIYTHLGIKRVRLALSESIAILEFIVHLLETIKTFNIHLLHDSYNSDFIFKDFCCLVKQDTSVFFEITTDSNTVRMSIEEPTIIKTIREYYLKTAKITAPVFNTKASLIAWINDLIRTIKHYEIY